MKKSQVLKNHNCCIDFRPRFGIMLGAFSHKFAYCTFSSSICASNFECIFNGNAPKWSPKTVYAPSPAPYSHMLWNFFRASIFGCILAMLWLPFGSLLAGFRLPLAIFGATIWRSFAQPGAPFSHVGVPQRHLLYFYCIFCENLMDIKDFPTISHRNVSFYAPELACKLPYAPLHLQSTQFSSAQSGYITAGNWDSGNEPPWDAFRSYVFWFWLVFCRSKNSSTFKVFPKPPKKENGHHEKSFFDTPKAWKALFVYVIKVISLESILKTTSERQWTKHETSSRNIPNMERTTVKNPFKNPCVFQIAPKTIFWRLWAASRRIEFFESFLASPWILRRRQNHPKSTKWRQKCLQHQLWVWSGCGPGTEHRPRAPFLWICAWFLVEFWLTVDQYLIRICPYSSAPPTSYNSYNLEEF